MCEIDYDCEPFEFTQESRPIARKPHTCDACGGVINPGEKYLNFSAKWGGRFSAEKLCGPCDEAWAAFGHEHGGGPNPSFWPEMLNECIAMDDESRARWTPMLEALRARQAASQSAAKEGLADVGC